MGGTIPNPSDRRVQRTRRMLREALVSLLVEHDWDTISVQDVCDRADVGRSTFYMHFADKEELVRAGFEDLRGMIRAGLASSPAPPEPFGFARGIIEHAGENRALFRALVGRRSGQVVLGLFRDMIVDLVREGLAATRAPGPGLEPAVHFLAGAFLSLLTWWLDAGGPIAPDDVERLFLQMATPALEAVARTERPRAARHDARHGPR